MRKLHQQQAQTITSQLHFKHPDNKLARPSLDPWDESQNLSLGECSHLIVKEGNVDVTALYRPTCTLKDCIYQLSSLLGVDLEEGQWSHSERDLVHYMVKPGAAEESIEDWICLLPPNCCCNR